MDLDIDKINWYYSVWRHTSLVIMIPDDDMRLCCRLIKKRRDLTFAVLHTEALALPELAERQRAEPTLVYVIMTILSLESR